MQHDRRRRPPGAGALAVGLALTAMLAFPVGSAGAVSEGSISPTTLSANGQEFQVTYSGNASDDQGATLVVEECVTDDRRPDFDPASHCSSLSRQFYFGVPESGTVTYGGQPAANPTAPFVGIDPENGAWSVCNPEAGAGNHDGGYLRIAASPDDVTGDVFAAFTCAVAGVGGAATAANSGGPGIVLPVGATAVVVLVGVYGTARHRRRTTSTPFASISTNHEGEPTQMKRLSRAVTAGVAVLGLCSLASPAGATPPPSTGFDDLPDVVVGGGSDTTYLISGDLTLLYNRSPGCALVTSSTDSNKGKCQPAATPGAGPWADWDRDSFVEATPTGASAGVQALLPAGPQYNPPIDYARSSRGPQGTELDSLTFWGYAQDGIAVYSFGTRAPGNFVSGADLYNIYNCTTTNWSQIPGYVGPAGSIFPYGINPSSGTYASFRDYLRTAGGNATFDPNAQGCVRKVAGADGVNGTGDDVFAFENDLKIQLEDKGPDNLANTADDDDNNKLTWSSASILGFPYLRQSGAPWRITGIAPDPGTIFAQTYPINRTVNHVTRNTDADCRDPGTPGTCGTGPDVPGADTGKGGAVREFTRFLCKVNNTQHLIDPVSGLGYKSLINGIISRNGFTQVPTALRTAGYACRVQT